MLDSKAMAAGHGIVARGVLFARLRGERDTTREVAQ